MQKAVSRNLGACDTLVHTTPQSRALSLGFADFVLISDAVALFPAGEPTSFRVSTGCDLSLSFMLHSG